MTDNEIRLEEVTSRLHDLEALSLASCDCDAHLEVKIREFGGGIHYVRQCTVCGRHRGGSLKKDQALKELNGLTPPQFDPSIEDIFYQKRRAISAEIMKLTAEKQQLLCVINGYQQDTHAARMAEYEKSTSWTEKGTGYFLWTEKGTGYFLR